MKFALVICVALIARIATALPIEEEHVEHVESVEHSETDEHKETVEECKSVEYDVGNYDFNHFVTNDMRVEVCRSNAHFNVSGRVQIKHLGEEYNYISHENPCMVVCNLDTQHIEGSPYTRAEYAALEKLTLHMAEDTVCGPEHMCDAHGCCVKEVEEVPEEHHEEEPAVKDEPNPISEIQYACLEAGVFADPYDDTSFFRCYLKSAHLKCAAGHVYRTESQRCVEKGSGASETVEHPEEEEHHEEHPEEHPEEHKEEEHLEEEHPKEEEHHEEEVHHEEETHEEEHKEEEHHEEEHKEEEHPVVLTEAERQALITCQTPGFFRAPYDCTKFYRCYGTLGYLQKGFFDCPAHLPFDEVSATCTQYELTAPCVNVL